MLNRTAAVALIVCASTASVSAVSAMDFPATPMNHGAPTNLPGETLIPGMTQAMQVVNAVTQPILQPILAPQEVMAPPPPAPMRHHRRHFAKKKMAIKKVS